MKWTELKHRTQCLALDKLSECYPDCWKVLAKSQTVHEVLFNTQSENSQIYHRDSTPRDEESKVNLQIASSCPIPVW